MNENKKLRVVYVADQSLNGGASEALLEIVCGLRDLGLVDPIVMTAFNGALEKRLQEKKIQFVRTGHRQFVYDLPGVGYEKVFFKCLRPVYIILYRLFNLYAIFKADREIDWKNVDLVHTNVNRNDIGGIMAKKYGIPHIWHIREHGNKDFELKFNRKNPIQYMKKLTTEFIAISDSVANEWINKGIDANKITLIYDGDDLERFKTHRFRQDTILKIVMMGAICPAKGQILLLEAIIKLPKEIREHVSVDFYGSGSRKYINSLKNYCTMHDLSLINFHDYTNMEDILGLYDIGVNCSQNEGFGRVTVEYMATGLCTVAFASGATPELIKNEVDGILFKSSSELSNIIKELYLNRERMETIARNGMETAKKRFNINDYLREIYSLYMRAKENKAES